MTHLCSTRGRLAKASTTLPRGHRDVNFRPPVENARLGGRESISEGLKEFEKKLTKIFFI